MKPPFVDCSSDLDLERIVQTVTDEATKLAGARFGAFFYNVTHRGGEGYLLYTLSGAPRAAFERFGLPRATTVFEPTFHGTGIVRLDDIRADARYGKNAPHHRMPKGHLPVVSYLAVPVISRSGDVMGGLFFGHDQPSVFTQEAEDTVAGIAAHAAVAIDNARLSATAQEEMQSKELLLQEFKHRIKNTLGTVEAIAMQTLRTAPVSVGKIRLAWEVKDNRLSLEWREKHGPAVPPPMRKGFGSLLIEQAIDGTATLTFAPGGVHH